MYDVIIVGGGPAGLGAALTLGRARRSTLLLDAGPGRNAPAEAVHNFLGHDGTPPAELRRIGRAQLAAYPEVEVRDAAAESARDLGGTGFGLVPAGGGTVQGRRLLLATGVRDEIPQVSGLAELWGKSAFHCPYCHGFEVSGKRVAVHGAGEEHARLALQLRRFSDEVALVTDGVALPDAAAALLAERGVVVRCEAVTRFEGTGGQLERIAFEGGAALERDAVFVGPVLRQRSPLAERLGCGLLPGGGVEVDDFERTTVAGVYAAGDMAHRAALPMPFAAVGPAAASGLVAGAMLDQELLRAEVGARLSESFKTAAPADA
ncbi:NAD(P)/FAD-dependent oxidoreductase [Streptomyces boninensis]|uniref:NAD(P)/FAD-dependent oxidoreductase n=1 Tax=Streptomyces boninensis TaxID=2039455 RepID=UPI003B21F862